jgi:hypothetical protein
MGFFLYEQNQNFAPSVLFVVVMVNGLVACKKI